MPCHGSLLNEHQVLSELDSVANILNLPVKTQHQEKNISDNPKYISNVKFLDFKYNWSVWIFRTDSKAQKGMNDAPLVFFLLASTGTPGHLMLSHHLPVQQGPLSSLQTALEDKGFYRERLTSQIIGFIGYMVFIAVMTPLKTTNEECD